MPIKFDGNVIAFLFIVILLLTMVISMKSRTTRILKIMFQLVVGGVFLIIFNFLGGYINIGIPLNPITAFFAGIFQIPGIAFLLIVKYIIYP